MPKIHEIYNLLDIGYEYANSAETTEFPFTQLDTVITNRLFTPDNTSSGSAVPEDLQIRVSKDIKFFVGATNDGALTDEYSLKISEIGDTSAINSQRPELKMYADKLNMNELIISNNASAVKLSTEKLLQIHSKNKIQMIGKVEFSNEVKLEQNVYVGKSLIFYDSGSFNSNQVRIGLQYNNSKDTLDIVKQYGSASDVRKKLMARLGQGGLLGNTDESLQDVPYYNSTPISSAFTTNAPVFDAENIWHQINDILYYGLVPGEKVGVGISNVGDNKFAVVGNTKINGVFIDTSNNDGLSDITGINTLTASNITSRTINTDNATINGNSTLNVVELTTINFKNNTMVSSFDGNMSTLSNDVAPWLNNDQNIVELSEFNNNTAGFISKLQEVVVDTKWRLREDGEELRIEKRKEDGTWEENFKFS